MTDEQIRRLRELEAKATPGPWTAKEPAFAPGIKARVFGPTYKGKFDGQETMAVPDADFISAARNALPELLDEVERLECELERSRDLVTALRCEVEAEQKKSERLEAENAALKARVAKLEEAAVTFVKKIAIVHENTLYKAVWESAWLHGINYDGGPTYTNELAALRAALDRAGEP